MRKNVKQLFKTILIISFLVIMTMISFEKEKKSIQASSGQVNKEYADEELNAEIVSNTSPETVTHTGTYQIQITVENCGSAIWSNSENIRLCIWQDDVDWGFRINIPDGVEIHNGEQWTFELNDFVLRDAAQTKLEFQMVKEGIAYFGEREAVVITAVN